LLGTPGSRSVIKDRRGQIVEDVGSIKPPQDGEDISLALDSKVQYLAYSQLKQAIADSKAKAGGVVVLDARTGEILALANWPTYNPNNRASLSGGQLRNRALTDTFEPGSTLKPFTIALAMETGKVRFDTPINCAPGRLRIGGRRFPIPIATAC
jgi:cell division protein FtsI (penicillin-binding protein 3)